MKTKPSEIRQRTSVELAQHLQSAEERLRDLRFRISGARLKNVREIRVARRAIARLKTITREKEEL